MLHSSGSNSKDHGLKARKDAIANGRNVSAASVTADRTNVNKVVAPGLLLFIDQILIAAAGWIFWLVVSKLTLSSEIGIATAFYSLAMLVTTGSQLGLEYPLLKRSSSDRSRILGTVVAIELALIVLSLPILLYLGNTMYGEESKGEYVWLIMGIVVLSSIGFVSRFALLGMSDARNVLIFDMAGTGLKFATGFLLVSLGYGGIGILASFVAYNMIIVAGTLAIAKKRLGFGLGSVSYAKDILKEGLANMPSKLSKMFILNLSVVLLAFIQTTNSSDVGVFYIELMISLAAGSVASSLAYMTVPASASSKNAARSEMSDGIRIGLGLTAIIVVALLAAPTFVLSMIGPNYASEGTSFFILCLSIIPAAILNSSIAKMNTSNKFKGLVMIGCLQIAVFLMTFFVLSPMYGLTGAAISILAASSIAAVLSLAWSHERSYLRSVAASSSAILAGWLAGYSLQLLQLPAVVLISVSVGVTIAALFGTRSISYSDIRIILRAGTKSGGSQAEEKKWHEKDQKPKTSLMLGNYGNFNIGDEMLLRAVIKDIRRSERRVVFEIPTRNPSFVDVYHSADSHLIEPLPLNAPLKLMQSFFKSDAIIVGGGGIWSGYTGPMAHFIPIVTIAGKLLGKQIEFRAIGIYSTASNMDKLLANFAILLADSCSVRGEESYQLLWKMNRKKVKQVDDLAVQYLRGLSPQEVAGAKVAPNTKKSLSFLKENEKIIIGISVKPVKRTEINSKVASEFSAAIDYLNSKYQGRFHFIFFPFAKTHSKVESDDELAKFIRARMSKDENVTIFEHSDPLSWFMTIKEYVDIFIGMRFHSIIFASEARKPLLCIPYERKITEFLKQRQADPSISAISLEGLKASQIVNFVEEQMKKTIRERESVA
ncbi:MAG: hypothetical protein E6K85_04675 [Thaumarchaeota archaeon]|nr:MAG: hypothetical protein E6K85_04675 [Nitrososphaerota archaeon]